MKKFGFTLAEVLITITILGLIAALTIPALMSNMDRAAWSSGLSSSFSILSRGFPQMMAEESVDSLDQTALWNDLVGSANDLTTPSVDLKNELGKYFNITAISSKFPYDVFKFDKSTKADDIGDTVRFELSNGSSMNIIFRKIPNEDCSTIVAAGGTLCEKMADIYVDVNGSKKPNAFGRDIYLFYVGNDGKVFPYGSNDTAIYDSSPEWNTTNGCQGKEPNDPLACTARVLKEGYTMK